jgi:hypothetical protein
MLAQIKLAFKALVLFVLFVTLASAAQVSYTWTIASRDIAPDGFSRPALVVNGIATSIYCRTFTSIEILVF